MNKIMIFSNPEFGEVRTVEIDGEPWLVGKDVAQALGYVNPRDALASHVDDEDKATVAIHDGSQNRNMTVINESGLYSLVLSSKLPGAKKFRRWVTSEVLPSIRKHGAYMTPATIEKILDDPDTIIRLATSLKEEREKRRALEAEKQQLQVDLDRSKEWYSIKRVACINGCSFCRFDWRKLKRESIAQGYGVKKIFDANYGEVNVYHMNVWERVYPEAEL